MNTYIGENKLLLKKNISLLSSIFSASLYLFFFLLFCTIFLSAASFRPFWIDEIISFPVKDLSFFQLFTQGLGGQCSRAPLFLGIEKIFLSFENWLVFKNYLDPEKASLVLQRIPSAMSASLFLCLVIRCTRGFPFLAFFIVAFFLQDMLFINHATEVRPYALWLLATYLITEKIFPILLFEESRRVPTKDWVCIGCYAALLALIATGSLFLFIGFFIATFLLCGDRKKIFLPLVASFLPAILFGVYYSFADNCVNHAANSSHSVIATVKNHDYNLIRAIIKIFVNPTALSELPINFVYLFSGYLIFRKPSAALHGYQKEKKYLLYLFLVFIPTALLTGAAIAYKNYYFVPRLFIYLLALRLGLLLICFRIFYEYWQKTSWWKSPYLRALSVIIFLVYTFYILARVRLAYPLSMLF